MRSTRIRRLNEEGMRRMREFLKSLDAEAAPSFDQARYLLSSPDTGQALPNAVEVDGDKVFARRFDLAAYLHERVPRLGVIDPIRDAGLWAWLALLWFEQLCPASKNGARKAGEHYRFIPELDNYRTRYRHRVLGPYIIYSAHRQDPHRAMCMLCQPPPIHPDTAEQLASRQYLIQSAALIGTATELYYDPSTRDLRKGATTYKGKEPKPGTLRRLVDVSAQFDRTFDLLGMAPDQFVSLLPREFGRFRPQRS